MDNAVPSRSAEIESLNNAYAALNRNDIAGFVKDFDPQIERLEPADFPLGGTYRGIDAVKAHIAQGRATWAEGTCTPERFVVAGDKIVLFIRIHVRLKDKTQWLDGEIGDVFTFRNGKVIQFRTFGEFHDALEWAGVRP